MGLSNSICLGIAGNFAHHLEQAGELEDFKDVKTKEANEPKGVFPFYLPNSECFLGTYCIGKENLHLPDYEANAQVEPEIGIKFDIEYLDDGSVKDIYPKAFSVFNDCTIRKDGAKKISEKKNWGVNSKGLAAKWINIDKFEDGGVMDNYHLCSFVKRDGILQEYGVDAPLVGYSYFYGKLKEWLVDKLNNQKDFGPLEDISKHLKNCNYPKELFVTIGATAYAEFGEKNYLKSGDEVYVVAYDNRYSTNNLEPSEDKIILKQLVK